MVLHFATERLNLEKRSAKKAELFILCGKPTPRIWGKLPFSFFLNFRLVHLFRYRLWMVLWVLVSAKTNIIPNRCLYTLVEIVCILMMLATFITIF